MPVATEMTVTPGSIQRGDKIYDRFTGVGGTDIVASDIGYGTKYVTIKNIKGVILSRRESSEKVFIERMMPTEEEIAAKKAQAEIEKREFFAECVQKWITSTIDGWQNFVNEQSVNIVKFPGDTYHDPIDNLMTQGAKVRIARHIKQIMADGYATDWADAFDAWAETARAFLIAGTGMSSNALSRSSSVIQNLTDDVYAAAMRKLLDNAKWGYLR